ncbi:MAG: response regulator transcription factor [Chlorobi bacterium]|nr:response regulator transcription factor [Chlorobiota bacterium]
MANGETRIKSRIYSVIVEDEESGRNTLRTLLRQNCPQVLVLGEATNVAEAVELIDELRPGLVFLDINLPDGAGFNIFDKVSHKSFEVIFTTAYNEFAVKAFEFSALHYLQKPFGAIELIEAVRRYGKTKMLNEKIEILGHNLQRANGKDMKLVLPVGNGNEIIGTNEIIYLEADEGYSTCFLSSNRSVLLSRTLSDLESQLALSHFIRIHRKHIINIQYIKRYKLGRDAYVVLENKIKLKISSARKDDFFERMNSFAEFL